VLEAGTNCEGYIETRTDCEESVVEANEEALRIVKTKIRDWKNKKGKTEIQQKHSSLIPCKEKKFLEREREFLN